ncbi:putative disease resistance protein RGA4 [Platanthera zijinensis]|uniref:Disease resistance protein RGA4 n=1 Tax=Platanthera zijinensis TaxID=2320716 RepID=A0AAP0G2U2_9ASPA
MSMILDAFVGSFVERLLRFVEEKAATVLGVKEDLKRLQRKLLRIESVLKDAERRSTEDFAINNWVKELKDCMYDADDIIDLCIYNAAQLLDQLPSSSSNPPPVTCLSFLSCCTSVPHRYEIGRRIKSLNDRLDEIYQDKLRFNLDGESNKPRVTIVNRRQTSPVEAELDIVGREIEDATKDLVKLMTASEGEAKRCRVFAITGMGGIGKTTLAAKIFNHWKMQTRFQIKVWICVSQTYNEIELLKQVIRAAEVSYGEATTRAELVPILQSSLSGKSVFLVLDDVWRSDVWIDLLRIPLQGAKIDSLVLITSRDENVVRQMGSFHIHPVVRLPVETGWEMLARRIAMIGGKEEEEISNLRGIGIQIIKKCSGLPLAIKVMAGVLAQKEPNAKEWNKVLNHDAWSAGKLHAELRGALYLSYDDLPSSLKQCFLYCSIFPEDFVFSCEQLVRMWVAEGFIKVEGYSLMEDRAEEYYHELTQRNLLQLDPLAYSDTGCKMHDMFRSLAQIISGDESFRKNFVDESNVPSGKIRRLSIEGDENVAGVLDAITDQRCLRTLLFFTRASVSYGNLGRFLYLRVLILTSSEIEIIPNAVGDMFRLRYLALDRTSIKKLPDSVGRLSNLQYLNLGWCDELTNLPQSITRLKNLRSLILPHERLAFIPKGIERLKQLNLLKGFFVANDSVTSQVEREQPIMHSTLTELSSLSNLRILHLFMLERARPGSLVLGELSQLKDMHLSCKSARGHSPEECSEIEERISLIQELFEELIPPQLLEKLNITCYFGLGYPKWIMSQSLGSHLPYLSTLELVSNMSCPLLPPLGQLPNLQTLYIHDAEAVKHIGPEFFGGGVASPISQTRTAFPKLQLLTISNMLNLEEWFFLDEKEENDDLPKLVLFPRLRELVLWVCPKLKALPYGLGSIALKKLIITRADKLKEVGNLPRVTECIRLRGNKSLERISNLPMLKLLIVKECHSLTTVECLNGLQQLDLINDYMSGLPGWLSRLAKECGRRGEDLNAEDDLLLQLWCNKRVLLRCQQGGQDWPAIQQIQQVNAYVHGGEGYLRYVKQPFFYETNI